MVIFSWAALLMRPLARISCAVSSSSSVSRLFVFVVVAMFHLYQKPVLEGLRDFIVISGEPRRDDLPQRRQLFVIDVVAFVFGEPEQKDCAIRPESDQHSKPASLTLPWPRDPLLDQAAAEIRIDQPTPCSFDRGHEAFIADSFALRKTGKSFGFENAHEHLDSSINYRYK